MSKHFGMANLNDPTAHQPIGQSLTERYVEIQIFLILFDPCIVTIITHIN